MATITTTTVLESLRYPNESAIERFRYDNTLWLLKRTSASQFDLFFSSNNGSSWGAFASSGITRANVQEISGLFIDASNTMHVCYRTYESGQDRIYYRFKDEFENDWSSEYLVAATAAGSAGAVYTGCSLISFSLNNTAYVFFAVGTRTGSASGVTLFAATLKYVYDYYGYYFGGYGYHKFAVRNSLINGTRQWLNGPDGVVHPAIDFKHTGDGKRVGSGPAVWVAWGRETLYCVKASWQSGPTWFGPNRPSVVAQGLTGQNHNTARYNGYGDRFHVAYPSGSTVAVVERRVDDSAGTVRLNPNTHPQGVVRYVALANNSYNNSFRVFAVGTSNSALYFADYDSRTGSWSSWGLISGGAIVGSTPTNFSVRRNNYGNGQYDVVVAQGSSPYTLSNAGGSFPVAPNAPVITTPSNGAAADVNVALVLEWTFSDDDPSDSQKAYAIRQVIGSTTRYWNNGTSSWQASEVLNTSGLTSKTFAIGWGADADQSHYYSVKVQDQANLSSVYSNSVMVIPSQKYNPTITSPGAVVTTPSINVSWNVTYQSAYSIVLMQGGGVVPGGDTGVVTDSLNTTAPLNYQLENGKNYSLYLTTYNDEGLASNTVVQNFTATFVPPPVAIVSITPKDAEGLIHLEVINPDPTGTQPSALSNLLYRRIVGDSSDGTKIADVGISPSVNLLSGLNPNFENAPLTGWQSNDPTKMTIARVTTQFHDGAASLEATAVNRFVGAFYNPLTSVAVQPNKDYTLSYWVRHAVNRNLHAQVVWLNSGGTQISTSARDNRVGTGDWQPGSLVVTSPATAAYAAVVVMASTDLTAPASEKAQVDTLDLRLSGGSGSASTYDDFTVAHLIEYEYRIVTTAVNNTVSKSDWTS